MDHMLTAVGEEGNNRQSSPFLPSPKPAGGQGKKGKIAYRHLPPSPRRIAAMLEEVSA